MNEGDTGGLTGRGCKPGEGKGEGAREAGFNVESTKSLAEVVVLASFCAGCRFTTCSAAVGGGEGGLLIEADEAREVLDSEDSIGIAAGLGDARGETFCTGLDNLDPPDVLATVFGPPMDLPGLEALEFGADSGESRLGIEAVEATFLATLGVSLSELSEADVEDSAGMYFGASLPKFGEGVVCGFWLIILL